MSWTWTGYRPNSADLLHSAALHGCRGEAAAGNSLNRPGRRAVEPQTSSRSRRTVVGVSVRVGGHVMVVHHTGKDTSKGARGHSSLRAAIDVELEVKPGLVTVTKSRDAATGDTFGFHLEVVPLGENSNGRVVTSVVAVNAEPAVTVKAPRLTKKQKCVVAALEAALAEHGQSPPEGSGAPADKTAVELVRWEDAAVRLTPGDDAGWRKRDHFKGIAKALQGKGVVSQHGGLVWLT